MKRLGLTSADIRVAAELVRHGGVIVYPTDTVYGLGCDPRHVEAVDRIFTLKGREEKSVPVLCDTMASVQTLVDLDDREKSFCQKFWPGPLTIVARLRAGDLATRVTSGRGTLGVRIPDHPGILKLIEACGGSLVGTSANRSGEPPPLTGKEAERSLGTGVDAILDGGPTKLGRESTVLILIGGSPRILREGVLPSSKILEALKEATRSA